MVHCLFIRWIATRGVIQAFFRVARQLQLLAGVLMRTRISSVDRMETLRSRTLHLYTQNIFGIQCLQKSRVRVSSHIGTLVTFYFHWFCIPVEWDNRIVAMFTGQNATKGIGSVIIETTAFIFFFQVGIRGRRIYTDWVRVAFAVHVGLFIEVLPHGTADDGGVVPWVVLDVGHHLTMVSPLRIVPVPARSVVGRRDRQMVDDGRRRSGVYFFWSILNKKNSEKQYTILVSQHYCTSYWLKYYIVFIAVINYLLWHLHLLQSVKYWRHWMYMKTAPPVKPTATTINFVQNGHAAIITK